MPGNTRFDLITYCGKEKKSIADKKRNTIFSSAFFLPADHAAEKRRNCGNDGKTVQSSFPSFSAGKGSGPVSVFFHDPLDIAEKNDIVHLICILLIVETIHLPHPERNDLP